MHKVVISGTGLFTPSQSISNEELVESFNAFVDRHNAAHADAIQAGEVDPLTHSSVEFIEKAIGISLVHGDDIREESFTLDHEQPAHNLFI